MVRIAHVKMFMLRCFMEFDLVACRPSAIGVRSVWCQSRAKERRCRCCCQQPA